MVDSNLNFFTMFDAVLNVREYIRVQRRDAVELWQYNKASPELEAESGKWTRRLNHIDEIIDEFIKTLDAEIDRTNWG